MATRTTVAASFRSMAEITKIHGGRDPDHVLDCAKGEYQSVVVIGFDHEGELDARASTNLTCAQINWIIDTFKLQLLDGYYHDD